MILNMAKVFIRGLAVRKSKAGGTMVNKKVKLNIQMIAVRAALAYGLTVNVNSGWMEHQRSPKVKEKVFRTIKQAYIQIK